jgi:NDP-sugar pyrophosphorylase family protein
MDALVLVGGYAKRLQPLTLRTPKALTPVAGKPVLTHLLERLREAGAKEVLVSLNPSQRKVEDLYGDGTREGLRIQYHYEAHRGEEHKPGALGAVLEAVQHYGPPRKGLVINGDNFVHGLNLGELAKLRERKKAAATIAFYELANKSLVEQYGIAALDKEGRILQFQEKPRVEEAVSQLASTGLYCWSEEFFTKHLPAYVESRKRAGQKADHMGAIFPHYLKSLPLYGLSFTGVWGDANTAETYIEMNKLAMNRLTVPAKNGHKGGGTLAGKQVAIAEDVHIEEGAVIKGPAILERGARVGRGAVVGPYTHLLHHAEVGERAQVSGSIVFEHARVGAGAHVQDALLDGKSSVGEGARLESYSIVGFESRVGARARLHGHSRLWPFVELGDESVVEGVVKAHVSPEEQERLDASRYWTE